jgi:hypothetical protein
MFHGSRFHYWLPTAQVTALQAIAHSPLVLSNILRDAQLKNHKVIPKKVTKLCHLCG